MAVRCQVSKLATRSAFRPHTHVTRSGGADLVACGLKPRWRSPLTNLATNSRNHPNPQTTHNTGNSLHNFGETYSICKLDFCLNPDKPIFGYLESRPSRNGWSYPKYRGNGPMFISSQINMTPVFGVVTNPFFEGQKETPGSCFALKRRGFSARASGRASACCKSCGAGRATSAMPGAPAGRFRALRGADVF